MIDLSAVIPSELQGTVIRQAATTHHLLAFTTACSQCVALLEKTPSLRDVAFDRLSGFMRGSVKVWNPDIIFLNSISRSGTVEGSRSLTDALVQSMASGVSAFDHNVDALYYRHDSLDVADRVANEDFITIKSLFGQVLPMLAQYYRAELAWAWDKHEPSPGGKSAARHQVVGDYHHSALKHDVEFQFMEQRLNADDKTRLLDVLGHQPADGLFKIFLRLADGRAAPLLSVFAVTLDEHVTDVHLATGPCYLVMAAGGIERYESFSELNSQLAWRLSRPSSHEPLLQSLFLSDLGGLPEGHAVDGGDLVYEPCMEPLQHCYVQGLRSKQATDFQFLLQQTSVSGDEYQTFLKRVGEVQVCAQVDEAMGLRFKSLSVRAEDLAQPQWLKYADADKREHYARLDSQYRERDTAVNALLQGVESLKVFASAEIDRYMRKQLGYSVDAQQIMINLPDEFDIQIGNFSSNYRKSLLEFAMHGLPAVRGIGQLSVPVPHSNPAFTFGFVKTMLNELDIPRRYRLQLRERLFQEATVRALTHRCDSALALSAWAAALQGHLPDERSQSLIHLLRGDNGHSGAELSLGSLTLAASGVRFKDLLVFRDRREANDDHYVLYAPGAPGGRDMFGFSSWRQLSMEIGSWLATDAGASYLLDQTVTTTEADHSDFLDKARRKGSLWRESSVVFHGLGGDNFEERLSGAIQHKVERALTRDEAALLGFITQTSYANSGVMALLDHRVQALNQAFVRSTNEMMSFEQFARREGSKLLNDYIRSNGFSQTVDTDTIYVDLDNAAYVANPDFTEYTRLRSLTSLFMEGFSDRYAFTPAAPMYSSVGHDLRALPLYFVQAVDKLLREAALGERYIQWLRDEFLDSGHDRYSYRRALFGRRLQFDMRSAAMRDFLKGKLSTRQYQWLVQLIVSLDKDVLKRDKSLQGRVKRSSASMFRYGGHILQGVYMLRDFSTSDGDFNLLYTPDAPDGISFRKLTDYVALMQSPDMRRYYYLRASYKGQPGVGSLLDDIERNIPPKRVNIENPEHQNIDRVSDIHELYDVLINRLIADVDAQTESMTERWAAGIYSIVRMMGSVLLMPFPAASLAWTTLHMSIDIQRGVLAYHDGDRATASWFFGTTVFGSLLGAAGIKTVLTRDQALVVQIGSWAVRKLASRIA